MRESNKIKRKRVFYYFAITEKDVDVNILADLKEFSIKRSMINREI